MPLTTIAFAPSAWGVTYSQTVVVADCWNEVMRTSDGGQTWSSIDPQPDHSNSAVTLHPTDPQTLYAGSATRGIYKTLDGGAGWELAVQGLTAVVPEHLAAAVDRPDTVYAVTELGLLKGILGGATWQSLPITGGVSFVAPDANTPDRVYAIGSDAGMGQDLPIYISGDGGATWPVTRYLTEPTRFNTYAHLDPVLVSDPSHTGLLLAGVRHAEITMGGAEGGSLYRSTDAGLSWTEIDVGRPISPVQDIAFDVVSPTVVYLATAGDWYDAGSGLFRSTDSGQTWQPIAAGVADLTRAKVIAVEPTAPYRVFALGAGRVYASLDRGLTWSPTDIQHGAFEDIHCSHAVPNSILYVAAPFGLLQSTDGYQITGRAAGTLGYVPIYALTEAVTDDRSVLYAGTTGGLVTMPTAQHVHPQDVDATLVHAGVYRYTTERTLRVYLPLALRSPG